MSKFILNEQNLSPIRIHKINAELEKRYNFSGKILSIKEYIEGLMQDGPLEFAETDGMIDWSRTKFNRMNYKEQKQYEEKLKQKRLYFINNIKVSKTVYDAVKSSTGALQ
jgi:hypothetical protein